MTDAVKLTLVVTKGATLEQATEDAFIHLVEMYKEAEWPIDPKHQNFVNLVKLKRFKEKGSKGVK